MELTSMLYSTSVAGTVHLQCFIVPSVARGYWVTGNLACQSMILAHCTCNKLSLMCDNSYTTAYFLTFDESKRLVVFMCMQFSLIVQHQEMHFIKHLHMLSLNENKIFFKRRCIASDSIIRMPCISYYNKVSSALDLRKIRVNHI